MFSDLACERHESSHSISRMWHGGNDHLVRLEISQDVFQRESEELLLFSWLPFPPRLLWQMVVSSVSLNGRAIPGLMLF